MANRIRQAERDIADVASRPFRNGFHLMPPVGWLNDPNGLCQFKSEYHVFFQYAPLSSVPGDPESFKCWGHMVSPDLVSWRYVGAPLLPDQSFDRDGVYSGSALVDEGKMYVYYTGNVKQDGEHDFIHSGREGNTILAVSEDGIHFGDKICLLRNQDYPGSYTCHVRDPKVFKEHDRFVMLLGGRENGDKGSVIVLESVDRLNWTVRETIGTPEPFGYMWECPDRFTIDGLTVLSVSPQGLARETDRFQNVYQSGYFPADSVSPDRFVEWDLGFDFYAPQTFEDEKGRRILIGWAGLPDIEPEYHNEPTVAEGWQHCLTVPRVLHGRNGKVSQWPVAEIQKLRREAVISTDADFRLFDAEIDGIGDRPFEARIGSGLLLAWEDGLFTMQFTDDSGCGRTSRHARTHKLENVRILVDRSIVEVFLNNGEQVMTTRMYSHDSGIRVTCEGCRSIIHRMERAENRVTHMPAQGNG